MTLNNKILEPTPLLSSSSSSSSSQLTYRHAATSSYRKRIIIVAQTRYGQHRCVGTKCQCHLMLVTRPRGRRRCASSESGALQPAMDLAGWPNPTSRLHAPAQRVPVRLSARDTVAGGEAPPETTRAVVAAVQPGPEQAARRRGIARDGLRGLGACASVWRRTPSEQQRQHRSSP